MTDSTLEQLELQQEKQERELLNHNIKVGKALEELKKEANFKLVFMSLFLEQGKSILWDNTKHLTEEQLKGRGSDKNLEVLEAIKGQIKSRLDLEGFMDTIEHDYENSILELEEQEAERKKQEEKGD